MGNTSKIENEKIIKKGFKENSGITLIALVITIIVLLILAGVTIATLTGDNGLLTKAGQAKNTSEKAGEKEKIQVEVAGVYDLTGKLVASQLESNIRNNIKDTTVTATTKEGSDEKFFPIKVTYNNGHKYGVLEDGKVIENLIEAGEKAPNDSNAAYISGDYIAVIPAGFTVSNEPGESSIENGLVVIDGSENEWVWIPTSSEDLAKMYVEDSTGWNMLITSSESTVNTKFKTRTLTTDEETVTNMILRLGSRNLPRTTPGTTDDPFYREPDVVSNDTDVNSRKLAGFVEADGTTVSSLETMATKLKDDYKDMIESVKKNKGFYIGRYEIGKDSSNNPQVKAGTVMNNTNWYNLYKACKSFSNEKVESRMIWGCQWDHVCRFIKGNGHNSIIDNSQSYGNYTNSTKSKDKSGSSNFNNTTGRSVDWKIKNLYDIAGNCGEWTQEAFSNFDRAYRGRRLLR